MKCVCSRGQTHLGCRLSPTFSPASSYLQVVTTHSHQVREVGIAFAARSACHAYFAAMLISAGNALHLLALALRVVGVSLCSAIRPWLVKRGWSGVIFPANCISVSCLPAADHHQAISMPEVLFADGTRPEQAYARSYTHDVVTCASAESSVLF